MKHFLFVSLFALTVLLFSACNDSNDNGGVPQQTTVQGSVILPDDYTVTRVFIDANSSSTFDDGESTIDVKADGTFTVQASSGYLLAAELTKDVIQPSFLAVSANVPITYTAPAGVSTLSSLTTLVKNRMELNPGMSVDTAVTKVKTDTGLTVDILSAAAYNDNVTDLNTNVTYITQKTVDYILGELGEANVNSSIIAFLYSSISNVLFAIASASDVDDLDDISNTIDDTIGSREELEEAIEKTETVINCEAWDLTKLIEVYFTRSDHTIISVSFTGYGMLMGDREDISDLKGGSLPKAGNVDSFTFLSNEKGGLGWHQVRSGYEWENFITSSFKTDLSNKTLTAEGGKTVNFSNGAYSYTMMYEQVPTIIPLGVEPLDYFGDNASNFAETWKYSESTSEILQRVNISGPSIIGGGTRIENNNGPKPQRGVITVVSNTAFSWAQENECLDSLFSNCYIAPKNGRYAKVSGNDYPDRSAKYIFTANDGTKWYLFYAKSDMVAGLTYEDGYAVSEGWYIYSLLHDPVELKFFNGIAARDIIKAW